MDLAYSFYTRPFNKGFDSYSKDIRIKAFVDFIIFKVSIAKNLQYFDKIHIVTDELGAYYLKCFDFNDKKIIIHNVLDNLIKDDYSIWTYGKVKSYQYLGLELLKPFLHIDQDAWFNKNPLQYLENLKTNKPSIIFQSEENNNIGKYLEFSNKLKLHNEKLYNKFFVMQSNISHCFSIYGALDKMTIFYSNEYCNLYFEAIKSFKDILLPESILNQNNKLYDAKYYGLNNWYNIIFEQMLGSLYFQSLNNEMNVISLLSKEEITPITTLDNTNSGFKHLWGEKNDEKKMFELINEFGDLNFIDRLKHFLDL